MQPVTAAPHNPAHMERECDGHIHRDIHCDRSGRRLMLLVWAAALLLGALLWGAPAALAAPPAQTTTCTVRKATLNLRSGPGTNYTIVTSLTQGTKLTQLSRTASGWLNVETQTTPKRTGYVNGAATYVTCTTTTAPVARTRRVIAPPGDGAGVEGFISVDPAELDAGYIRFDDDENNLVFERNMWLRAEVDDDEIGGVDHVVFSVTPNDYFDESLNEFGQVYSRRENTDGYCIFGGGEPNCTSLRLNEGVSWPGTDHPIYNGSYQLSVAFYAEGNEDFGNADAVWFVNLFIDSPELEGPPGSEGSSPPEVQPSELQVELRETMPGSVESNVFDELNFRVAAWDPAVGDDDGDGIDGVLLEIFSAGELVHARTEGTAGFCAFGGGEPDCTTWNFPDNGWSWPDGASVDGGESLLRATVFADDGRSIEATWTIFIQ